MKIHTYKKINLTCPTMIASFPGMGNVAIRAADYLRRKLDLEPFAQIDVAEFLFPEMVLIENGIARLPPQPKYVFYYKENPELIVFEGQFQLREKASIILMEHILNFAKELRVQTIFTGASFPSPINYDTQSKLYCVANTIELKNSLTTQYHLKFIENGEIAGLNGLLLSYAKQLKIPAACILATIPIYAMNLPNPKASKALIKLFEKVLGLKISFAELDAQIREVRRGMSELEYQMMEQFNVSQKNEEHIDEETEVPHFVKEKIERLFYEARYDRKRVYTLKKELDRWNLFESYEDRFLDLFKKS